MRTKGNSSPSMRFNMQANKIKSILIVGGGTAGWLTAGILAAKHSKNVQVTLLEATDIPTIGVGEGTWPTMKSTLQTMGINESDFFNFCDVSFKQGAKFCRWLTGDMNDFYYHPLTLPIDFTHTDLAPYWLNNQALGSFSQTVCFQEAICEQGLAPKTLTMPQYASAANYAYHLDAGKFATFLKEFCTSKLGVKNKIGKVVKVTHSTPGNIESLQTSNGDIHNADLYIDCSGTSSILLGQSLNTKFIDKSDVLFIDKAIAVQASYESQDSKILPYTLSTAQSAGWIWDIQLQTRKGIGHVYSSQHINTQQAERELLNYLGKKQLPENAKLLDIKCGHREVFWKNNCVAIGMAAGFLEPLEASALVLVELSANFVRDNLPKYDDLMPIIAKRFNQIQLNRWNDIIDFLKLHYLLSNRTDNQFWLDNKSPATIPDSLKESLQIWRSRTPNQHDFPLADNVFPAASYQYVLYGMKFQTEYSALEIASTSEEKIKTNQAMISKALSLLPDNKSLLNKIRLYGMQGV